MRERVPNRRSSDGERSKNLISTLQRTFTNTSKNHHTFKKNGDERSGFAVLRLVDTEFDVFENARHQIAPANDSIANVLDDLLFTDAKCLRTTQSRVGGTGIQWYRDTRMTRRTENGNNARWKASKKSTRTRVATMQADVWAEGRMNRSLVKKMWTVFIQWANKSQS